MRPSAFLSMTVGEAWSLAQSRGFVVTLCLILPCLGVLAGLELAWIYAELEGTRLPPQFSLSSEAGIAEWFEYGLSGTAALCLLMAWRRSAAPAYLATGLVSAWLVLENSLAIHEKTGVALAPLMTTLNVSAQLNEPFSELAALVVTGLILTAIIIWGIRNSPPRAAAHAALILCALIVGSGFGIALDFFNSLDLLTPVLAYAANIIEDGGELAIQALIAAFSVAILASRWADRQRPETRNRPPSLQDIDQEASGAPQPRPR